MNYPPYPFTCFSESDNTTFYAFTSVGPIKAIQKLVIFMPTDQNTYNLALVDLLDSGELSDIVVSANEDMAQVLATVIQIILDFLHDKPSATVSFKGSTPSRNRLYRAVISKYLDDITNVCVVQGLTPEGRIESLQPNQTYTAFVVSLL